MRDTSLEAYQSIDLQKREKEVLQVIERIQPCYNEKIAEAIGWPINMVTGRVNGLYKKGIIKDHDKVKNTRGRSVIRWVVTSRQLRLL